MKGTFILTRTACLILGFVVTISVIGCGSDSSTRPSVITIEVSGIPVDEQLLVHTDRLGILTFTEDGTTSLSLENRIDISEWSISREPRLTRCEIEDPVLVRNSIGLSIVCTSNVVGFVPLVDLNSLVGEGERRAFWLHRLGPLAVFTLSNESRRGNNLWISDGTASGTLAITNLEVDEGFYGSSTEFNDGFLATSIGANGLGEARLWFSDGSVAGSYVIEGSGPDSGGSRINQLSRLGLGAIWYRNYRDSDNDYLRFFDGLDVGTIFQGNSVYSPIDPLIVQQNSTAILRIRGSDEEGFWVRVDGEDWSSEVIEGFEQWFPGEWILGPSSGNHGFINVFELDELWTTAGEIGNTNKIADSVHATYAIPSVALPDVFEPEVNSYFLGRVDDELGRSHLKAFRTDGTEDGTAQISEASVIPLGDTPLYVANRAIYFPGYTDVAVSPYVYRNGEAKRIVQFELNARLDSFVGFRGLTYFVGYNPDIDSDDVWVTDDTAEGTKPLGTGLHSIHDLFASESHLYLQGRDAEGRYRLWVSSE